MECSQWELMQLALHDAANIYEELAGDSATMQARDMTREEALVECGMFRASELHPIGTRERIAALEAERDNWMETARQYAKNEDYYQEQRDNLRESIERFLALVKTEPDYATPSVILDWWKEVLTGTTNSVAQSDP